MRSRHLRVRWTYFADRAMDGDRFRSQAGVAWRGLVDAVDGWWWQVKFAELRQIGSIQQIHGEAGELLTNSPQSYVWQHSDDGIVWRDLLETAIANETRLFRIHRLKRRVEVRYLRLHIARARRRVSNAARGRILPGNGLTDRVSRMDPLGEHHGSCRQPGWVRARPSGTAHGHREGSTCPAHRRAARHAGVCHGRTSPVVHVSQWQLQRLV